MRTASLILAAAALLSACATPCPPTSTEPTNVSYDCEDGSALQVTFRRSPDSALIVQDGFSALTLPASLSGSGYRYAAEGAELRGRGEEARWTRPGAAETLCREVH
jgi:membrane-bound inhibitor of C-type lysozyme